MQHLNHPSDPDQSALSAAAETLGIEPRYWDIFGVEHFASPEVLTAMIQSIGADGGPRETGRLLPKTLVISQNIQTLQVPAELAEGIVSMVFHWESGERVESQTKMHDAVLPLPAGLPLGYHTIELRTEKGVTTSTRLIVCPDRAYQPEWLQTGRAGGIALSLYGVRSNRNWGCGDFTDLEHLAAWVADDTRAAFLALNPLHSIPNRQPYNTSPYLPNSSFYRNFIYLDLERIQEFSGDPGAQRLAASDHFQKHIAQLRESQLVEYERVSHLKLRFLKLLFWTFLDREYCQDTPRAREFKHYVKREGGLLHSYALYCALDEWLHKAHPEMWNWRSWPKEFQSPDSPQVVAFAQDHWPNVLFHKYVQWQIDGQLRTAQERARQLGLSIGLYHDLALATDSFGSDLWAHGAFYVKGCRVGSPPDNFSPKGQDWGFPPPNARQHFDDGYRQFAESIRKNSAHGGALRIDHVMRFFRLYWIPDGMEATEGTYVRERYEDLLRILALESVRGQFVVVGEDLGTVPDYVREMLEHFGILSYRLLYFEQDQGREFRPFEEYPRQALVSASTHDLPTLAGFWLGRDIAARRDAGVISEEAFQVTLSERAAEKQKMLDLLHRAGLLRDDFPRDAGAVPELHPELHNAIVGFLCSTPCQLMVLNQEDLFKETEQQNLPGTTAEYPNWRHKMKYSLEELQSGTARPFTDMFRGWLERTGRAE